MNEDMDGLCCEVYKALAHPARVKIIDLLREGERCVCELAPLVGVSDSNLSQHLGLLRKSGLVATRREGHSIYYRIGSPAVLELSEKVREVVLGRLSSMAAAMKGTG